MLVVVTEATKAVPALEQQTYYLVPNRELYTIGRDGPGTTNDIKMPKGSQANGISKLHAQIRVERF